MSSKVGDSVHCSCFATAKSYVIKVNSSPHALETDCDRFSVSLMTSSLVGGCCMCSIFALDFHRQHGVNFKQRKYLINNDAVSFTLIVSTC